MQLRPVLLGLGSLVENALDATAVDGALGVVGPHALDARDLALLREVLAPVEDCAHGDERQCAERTQRRYLNCSMGR